MGCGGKGGGPVYIFNVALFAEPKVKPGEGRPWSDKELGWGGTLHLLSNSVKRR